jgi:membrane protease YdiL (CAAX protease family)
MEVNEEKPVWLVLLLVIASACVGVLMGSAIGAGVAALIYEGSGNFSQAMLNPTDESLRIPLLIVQGITTVFGFLIVPYLVWNALRKKGISYFVGAGFSAASLLLVFVIVIAFAVADSAIIEWNQNIHFPEFLKSFEEWARAKEDQLAELTKMITNFQSPLEFTIALVVVAIFAGICEEFLFRGIIQTELFRGTKNIHVAIWVSAFLFSAIHAQFFGFVPRMLLGGLFGYLYYWSGNLIVPMFAHFVNNGFALTAMYLYQQKVVTTNLDTPESAPWPAVIISVGVVAIILFYFKKKFQSSNPILT